jgi:alanine racemase
MPRPTVAEIDLAAILENLKTLRSALRPETEVIGIVKADAYGHGLVEVSRTLATAGVRRFAVAIVEEAMALRDAGVPGRFLVLGAPLLEQAEEIAANDFEAMVSDLQFAQLLNATARRRGRVVGVHLKFDTGMGRLGFSLDEAVGAARQVADMPSLRIVGAMTHFPTADVPEDRKFTREQVESLRLLRARLEEAGIHIPLWHAANSSAALTLPESHFDAVRPGLALYGGLRRDLTPLIFRQAMSLKTRIVQIRELPEGHSVSYGRTFVARRPTRVGVLPIGYADGLSRAHSNKGFVLVRGRRAPIAGRVCMDMTMVDVTDIRTAAPGDEAVIYGRQGDEEITLRGAAESLGTIPYELMTAIGSRVPRTYLNQPQDIVLYKVTRLMEAAGSSERGESPPPARESKAWRARRAAGRRDTAS